MSLWKLNVGYLFTTVEIGSTERDLNLILWKSLNYCNCCSTKATKHTIVESTEELILYWLQYIILRITLIYLKGTYFRLFVVFWCFLGSILESSSSKSEYSQIHLLTVCNKTGAVAGFSAFSVEFLKSIITVRRNGIRWKNEDK